MRRQGRRDTKPEVELRHSLWARGVRGYRVDWPLPFERRRRADIAWPGRRVAVFVDGCFWHRCPEHFTLPKSNQQWWRNKIDRNVERDRDTDTRLASAGWSHVRIWEHEALDAAVAAVEDLLLE